MASTTSELCDLGCGHSAYLRPSFSDWARLQEYRSSIYVPNNKFTSAVQNLKPNFLLDIGANIGLSSLSLLSSFRSVHQVVGIEAEKENFEVLKMNYEYWSKKTPFREENCIKFQPIYAIASDISASDVINISATRLTGGVSASGTFKFTSLQQDANLPTLLKNDPQNPKLEFSNRKISLSEVFNTYLGDNPLATAVVKIDIEGGEEELFLGLSDWLNRTAFLTVEIHDSMGAPCSSRALLEKLVLHDFAIVPEEDVLHCYNRKLLSLT